LNAIPRQQQQFTRRLYPPGPSPGIQSLDSRFTPCRCHCILTPSLQYPMSVNSSLILRLSHLSMQLSTSSLPTFIPQLPNPVVGFAAACAVALLSSRHLRHLVARSSVVCSISITLRRFVVMSSFFTPTPSCYFLSFRSAFLFRQSSSLGD
jgi:hypothetical protein